MVGRGASLTMTLIGCSSSTTCSLSSCIKIYICQCQQIYMYLGGEEVGHRFGSLQAPNQRKLYTNVNQRKWYTNVQRNWYINILTGLSNMGHRCLTRSLHKVTYMSILYKIVNQRHIYYMDEKWCFQRKQYTYLLARQRWVTDLVLFKH